MSQATREARIRVYESNTKKEKQVLGFPWKVDLTLLPPNIAHSSKHLSRKSNNLSLRQEDSAGPLVEQTYMWAES